MGEKLNGENYSSKEMDREKESCAELNLEQVLLQVQNCISQLENPQISLEDSFRYYEEGVRKLKICSDKVAQIEKKMLMINSQGELEDFCGQADEV